MNSVYQTERSKRGLPLALVLACGAQFMVVLDGLIVNVTLPDMKSGLGLSTSGQQWVINGYLITGGGFLLLASRAADLLGHRRVFLFGLAVFSLASLAGGLSPNGSFLLVARVVQGIGAAALAPASLSLLTTTHTGQDNTRALSLWSATSGSAGALGLVLGGIITGTLGWRWVLLINVPVGVVLWILASTSLPRSRRVDRAPLDLPGAILITLSIGALVYGISQANETGWASARVFLALVSFVVLIMFFLRVERDNRDALIPLAIFRRRTIIVANTVMVFLGVIMTATLFFLSQYEQRVLGYSPLRTGLSLLPMSIVITLGAMASKTLLPKIGARRMLTGGALVMVAGLLWMADLSTRADYPVHILGPTLLWAAGASIVTMPCVSIATRGIEPELAGLASGLINTARQTGGAIGIAALSSIAAAVTTRAHSGDPYQNIVHGYAAALIVASGIALLVALIASQHNQADPA